jgi:hypothetical protein
MPGDGPGSRARGVPERGARTGQMRRGPPHRRESRVQTRPLTAVTADADRRRSLSADGPGSRVIFFRDCPLVFGCLNPLNHDGSRFSRFVSDAKFILLYSFGFISPFSILVSRLLDFFFTFPSPREIRHSESDFCAITFCFSVVFARAHRTSRTPAHEARARTRVRSGRRTRDGAVAALPSASWLGGPGSGTGERRESTCTRP